MQVAIHLRQCKTHSLRICETIVLSLPSFGLAACIEETKVKIAKFRRR